jgi:trigger factor
VEREAKLEDLLNIDVEGTVEGKVVVSEKGGWYPLSPGPSSSLPGFSEQLEGAKKGEEKTFVLKLSQDFKELAGQECNFKVLVNDIKQKNLPDLDDEYAKSLGRGVETLDALRAKISSDIKSEKERVARARLEAKAIDALVAISRLEYPDILVENEIDRLVDERKQYLGEKDSLENYLKNAKKTEEEFRNELKPMAEAFIKSSLVVEKLGGLEKIEVGDSEVEAAVERVIQGANNDERVRQLFSSASGRESLRRNINIQKTIDRLVDIATKVEETTTLEGKEGGKENGEPTK